MREKLRAQNKKIIQYFFCGLWDTILGRTCSFKSSLLHTYTWGRDTTVIILTIWHWSFAWDFFSSSISQIKLCFCGSDSLFFRTKIKKKESKWHDADEGMHEVTTCCRYEEKPVRCVLWEYVLVPFQHVLRRGAVSPFRLSRVPNPLLAVDLNDYFSFVQVLRQLKQWYMKTYIQALNQK